MGYVILYFQSKPRFKISLHAKCNISFQIGVMQRTSNLEWNTRNVIFFFTGKLQILFQLFYFRYMTLNKLSHEQNIVIFYDSKQERSIDNNGRNFADSCTHVHKFNGGCGCCFSAELISLTMRNKYIN